MKRKKINCETARDFSVEKALEKLGHFPKRATEKEAWFLSPFRSETQASFKVSKAKNRWYDHGEGVGGNVIDLVCRILKCSIQDTLVFLSDSIPINIMEQQHQWDPTAINIMTGAHIEIIKVQEIIHPALIQYVNLRGISAMIARTYCKEVWYRYKDSQFFAIGLRNIKNGWELRNKIFKNSSSPKSFTYIQNNNKQLIMLEGMFDLLSLTTLDPELLNTSDILVLNSIAFIRAIEDYLEKYESVHLYLDNDKAGERATEYLTKKYKHVIDQSRFYKNRIPSNGQIAMAAGDYIIGLKEMWADALTDPYYYIYLAHVFVATATNLNAAKSSTTTFEDNKIKFNSVTESGSTYPNIEIVNRTYSQYKDLISQKYNINWNTVSNTSNGPIQVIEVGNTKYVARPIASNSNYNLTIEYWRNGVKIGVFRFNN